MRARGASRCRELLAGAVCLAAGGSAAAGLLDAGTRLRVDPETAEVGFELPATLHTVHGTARAVGGSVTIVAREEVPDSEILSLAGSVFVDAASLDTGNARRDRKMHRKSLDVGRFPEIRFVPDRLALRPAESPGSDERFGTLAGSLTIRDRTRPLEIDVTLVRAESRVTLLGAFDVRWSAFGVPDPSVLLLRVKPVARASFLVHLLPDERPAVGRE